MEGQRKYIFTVYRKIESPVIKTKEYGALNTKFYLKNLSLTLYLMQVFDNESY